MDDDKRQYARTPIDQPVEFRIKDGNVMVPGVVRDISIGGAFIATAEPAPFNARVVVKIMLPTDDREVEIEGTVRWTKESGMGVQFGVLGARETHILTELDRTYRES